MLEVVAAFARWLQLAANFILLGSYICLIIAKSGTGNIASNYKSWMEKLERLLPWFAIVIPLGLMVVMASTIVQITGNVSNLFQPDQWISITTDTRAGQIWILRIGISLLLLILIFVFNKIQKTVYHYSFFAIAASLPLIVSTFASHTALEALSLTTILPYAIHVVLAAVWLGALPVLLLLMYEDKKLASFEVTRNSDLSLVLNRFSSVAFPAMLLIILTGVVVSDHIFNDYYAAVIATPYGWLLSSKIVLLIFILLIANRVRSKWLPALSQSIQMTDSVKTKENLRKWVGFEFVLAMILLLLATLLTNSVPVKDLNIEKWPLPFRFSIDATWNLPNVALQVWIGVAILSIAIVLMAWERLQHGKVKRLIPTVLILIGASVALQAIAIRAYPETYQKPMESFNAISIANGATLFSEHCVECHGIQGKGNGIKSRTLSTKLPDLLMEPHIVEHTPGDFYHWITYGMENTDMPGFKEKLSNEDRWDLINFLHALSRGYQSRILSPEVNPGKAYMQPPLFSYSTQDGNTGTLQDFRGNKTVLLVVFSWPQSQVRLNELKTAHSQLEQQKVMVIAVPSNELDEVQQESLSKKFPFVVVSQGASEIATSYSLSRRTVTHPDIIGRGTQYDHMEFLIDKSGYLRARWIPSIDERNWSDVNFLNQQASLLNRENLPSSPTKEYVQ